MNWLNKDEKSRVWAQGVLTDLHEGLCPECGSSLHSNKVTGLIGHIAYAKNWARKYGVQVDEYSVMSPERMAIYDSKFNGWITLKCENNHSFIVVCKRVDFWQRYPSFKNKIRWHIANVTGANSTWHFEWPLLTEADWDHLLQWGPVWKGSPEPPIRITAKSASVG